MVDNIQNFLYDMVSSFTFISLIDVIITAFVIYKIIGWVKGTQALQVAKGVLIVLFVTLVSEWVGLITINYIFKSVITVGILAVVIIFQPELRRALDKLGSAKFLSGLQKFDRDADISLVIGEIVDAVKEMSATKTGALIVIERESKLGDIIDTGVKLNARITKNLLLNIFYPKTPLHDGAVIISKDELLIKSAASLLPLTQNRNINKQIGTRHRSAIGISENYDCLVLVVSEETGVISYAINGRLSRYIDLMTIETLLKETLESEEKRINFKRGKK